MIVFQAILCLVFHFYTRLETVVEILHSLWCLQQPPFFPPVPHIGFTFCSKNDTDVMWW